MKKLVGQSLLFLEKEEILKWNYFNCLQTILKSRVKDESFVLKLTLKMMIF